MTEKPDQVPTPAVQEKVTVQRPAKVAQVVDPQLGHDGHRVLVAHGDGTELYGPARAHGVVSASFRERARPRASATRAICSAVISGKSGRVSARRS